MTTILIAFAIVCATLAAFGVPSGRFNLTAASLAFYFVSLIVRLAVVSALMLSLVSCQNPTPQQSLIMDRAGKAVLVAIDYAEAKGKIDPVDAQLARQLGTIVLPPAPVVEPVSGK